MHSFKNINLYTDFFDNINESIELEKKEIDIFENFFNGKNTTHIYRIGYFGVSDNKTKISFFLNHNDRCFLKTPIFSINFNMGKKINKSTSLFLSEKLPELYIKYSSHKKIMEKLKDLKL